MLAQRAADSWARHGSRSNARIALSGKSLPSKFKACAGLMPWMGGGRRHLRFVYSRAGEATTAGQGRQQRSRSEDGRTAGKGRSGGVRSSSMDIIRSRSLSTGYAGPASVAGTVPSEGGAEVGRDRPRAPRDKSKDHTRDDLVYRYRGVCPVSINRPCSCPPAYSPEVTEATRDSAQGQAGQLVSGQEATRARDTVAKASAPSRVSSASRSESARQSALAPGHSRNTTSADARAAQAQRGPVLVHIPDKTSKGVGMSGKAWSHVQPSAEALDVMHSAALLATVRLEAKALQGPNEAASGQTMDRRQGTVGPRGQVPFEHGPQTGPAGNNMRQQSVRPDQPGSYGQLPGRGQATGHTWAVRGSASQGHDHPSLRPVEPMATMEPRPVTPSPSVGSVVSSHHAGQGREWQGSSSSVFGAGAQYQANGGRLFGRGGPSHESAFRVASIGRGTPSRAPGPDGQQFQTGQGRPWERRQAYGLPGHTATAAQEHAQAFSQAYGHVAYEQGPAMQVAAVARQPQVQAPAYPAYAQAYDPWAQYGQHGWAAQGMAAAAHGQLSMAGHDIQQGLKANRRLHAEAAPWHPTAMPHEDQGEAAAWYLQAQAQAQGMAMTSQAQQMGQMGIPMPVSMAQVLQIQLGQAVPQPVPVEQPQVLSQGHAVPPQMGMGHPMVPPGYALVPVMLQVPIAGGGQQAVQGVHVLQPGAVGQSGQLPVAGQHTL